MKAVVVHATIPRYLATRALGRLWPGAYLSQVSPVQLREIPEPRLPGPEWLRVHVDLAGICGSDLSLVHLETSLAASVYASMPFVIGHENVGTVVEAGPDAGAAVGSRVVVEPLLPCAARGFADPCAACARGDYNLCSRFAEGALAPGLGHGACRDVGGSWGEVLVAHRSQLVPVPPQMADEQAVMVEPLAVAVHAVLRFVPPDAATVLVAGAGTIGLASVAALRALRPASQAVVLARHPHQAALARRLGASAVVTPDRGAHYQEIARLTGARVLRPLLGLPVLTGGVDVVLECVGRARSIDDALRLTRAGGTVVLVGLAAVPQGVDWTPIWLREVSVRGTFAYAWERVDGRAVRSIDLAMELLASGQVDLQPLVTHRFPLVEYRRAIDVAGDKRRHRAVKVVLQPRPA
ncbi:MAG: alcohol dehydrogenase catalytic domain-containing protein [Armatimonadota bacterium]|nr:alcohol dehydrogenase catalytic domain-containing protein [Armatimonadota bacterium]MDR7520771.1 alcohol dehydrogenase catalytic domain-containing protein [Armatimonadota bacterium]MDR7550002.1 alcohol dehydrogenase catalytic domain-containing protein [Armatimonadota bacterium]